MAAGLVAKNGGFDAMRKTTPNRKNGAPEDIAAVMVFLSSRAAAHINGATIEIDGGKGWDHHSRANL